MAAFQDTFYRCFIEDNRWRYLTRGLGNTLLITFFALLIGVALGVVVAIVRTSWDKNRDGMRPGPGRVLLGLANGVCRIYLTVIRGTPVVVQLLLGVFVILVALGSDVVIACIVFGVNSGAYVAEIIRSVAGYAGVIDLTKGGEIIRGRTFEAFMPLIAVAAIYLVMVVFFTWLVGRLERRLRNSER